MPDYRISAALLLALLAAGCRAPERIEASPCLAATKQTPMGPRLEAALEEITQAAGLRKDDSTQGQWDFVREDGSVALRFIRPGSEGGGVVAQFRAPGGVPESDAERTLRSEIGEFPLWFAGISACSQVQGLQAPVVIVD
jgi:hypothetical protein